MNIHVLQHEAFEGPGSITFWAKTRHYPVEKTLLFNEESYPDSHSLDLLIVMGGSMSVYDEDQYPWLKQEKAFIEECIASDKKVLGICLGAQLIAEVLGSEITKNPEREIGWFPVRWNKQAHKRAPFNMFPEQQMVFHWHGDTFSLPNGAIHLADSAACRQQAFMYTENVIAFQFHLETTRKYLSGMLENGEAELEEQDHYVQSAKEILDQTKYCDKNKALMSQFLDYFIAI